MKHHRTNTQFTLYWQFESNQRTRAIGKWQNTPVLNGLMRHGIPSVVARRLALDANIVTRKPSQSASVECPGIPMSRVSISVWCQKSLPNCYVGQSRE